MKELEQKIVTEGSVLPGHILKVGTFLNQRIDVDFMMKMGEEVASLYANEGITKVLTIEASGIAIGCAVARLLGVPLVSAKKSRSINIDGEAYVAEVESYDTKKRNLVVISKKFLSSDDHVLIVDDFLANGFALQGLISLVEAAEATVEGLGIVIEKGFQEGGHRMRNLGYHLESLAVIESMDIHTGAITFRE